MDKRISRIVDWIEGYADDAGKEALVVGVSGGVDSALVSTLCCLTGRKVHLLSMPVRSKKDDSNRSRLHLEWLKDRFPEKAKAKVIPLTMTFREFEDVMHHDGFKDGHASANSKSRLRMMCLYHVAGSVNGLVVGTGNRVEDFGVGFFTKWGDGGVDLSPIGDLMKSEVQELALLLEIDEDIVLQAPTDGLWEDGRTDEDQLKMSYEEIEKCMRNEFVGEKKMARYEAIRRANRHKMEPIPVCMMEDWNF